MAEPIDWSRLHKALAVESQHGFIDLVGQQYQFSEFLCITLGKPPAQLLRPDQEQWRDLAREFSHYPELTVSERKRLLGITARLLTEAEAQIAAWVEQQPAPRPVSLPTVKQQPTPFASQAIEQSTNQPSGEIVALDRPLKDLPKISAKAAESLARLGLYYVRDLLFYYPRDYIDYARQVDIRSLAIGETVTLVGQVKRCSCFTSTKNTKLTILEMVLGDPTGQIKLGRFYAGSRYSSRGWQEMIKKRFASGVVVAASGLVKSQGKWRCWARAKIPFLRCGLVEFCRCIPLPRGLVPIWSGDRWCRLYPVLP
jgi:ATP-dependent DNA helicase RecG